MTTSTGNTSGLAVNDLPAGLRQMRGGNAASTCRPAPMWAERQVLITRTHRFDPLTAFQLRAASMAAFA